MFKIHKLVGSVFIVASMALPLSACAQDAEQTSEKTEMRQYMFVADIGAAGWQQLIDNPSDREPAARKSIEQLGGELVGYYFGFNDSRNYVIVNLPDRQTAKAIQVLRLSSGMLDNYQIIELMSPGDIEIIAQSMNKLNQVDDIQKADD